MTKSYCLVIGARVYFRPNMKPIIQDRQKFYENLQFFDGLLVPSRRRQAIRETH